MDVLGRYRNLIVLVGVLFAQILGLAVQVRRTTDNEPTRLIRIWAVDAVTPLEKVLVWVQTSTGNVWHNYFYLRGVRAENRSLKQQIERMSLEQVRMSQDADQARRLQALLAFKEQFISQTMAAQVIGSSGSELSRSVYIDKGERDGIKPDMAVITADGIVGKVLRVYALHFAGAADQRSDQWSGRDPRQDAAARHTARHAVGRSGAGKSDERRNRARRRTGSYQWRRRHFPQGPAGGQSDEGCAGQRSVSQHSRASRGRSQQTGRSAGGNEDRREAGGAGPDGSSARGRHSGRDGCRAFLPSRKMP